MHEHGLANELLSKIYLVNNKTKIAKLYIEDACISYSEWGASRLVHKLKDEHHELFLKNIIKEGEKQTGNLYATNSLNRRSYDLFSIMRAAESITKEVEIKKMLTNLIKVVAECSGAQKSYLALVKRGQWSIEAEYTIGGDAQVMHSAPVNSVLPELLFNFVLHASKVVIINDARNDDKFLSPEETKLHKSILCLPLVNQGELYGILYLKNDLITNAFTEDKFDVLRLLTGQIIISIKNAKIYSSYVRFIPKEFFQLLEKDNVTDIELGDHIQKKMTILFSDIRNFTSQSERMTPKENFSFINEYLSHMEPIIRQHGGFIDKYMGDGIMALFSSNPDDAVTAAINMINALRNYNEQRVKAGHDEIAIGIGLNRGNLMLGAVGDNDRLDITVISDAVNAASRIETLTKLYKAPILITHNVYSNLINPSKFLIRRLGKIAVKGKKKRILVYEVFDADPAASKELKLKTLENYTKAISLFNEKRFNDALMQFKGIFKINPNDTVVQRWIAQTEEKLRKMQKEFH